MIEARGRDVGGTKGMRKKGVLGPGVLICLERFYDGAGDSFTNGFNFFLRP